MDYKARVSSPEGIKSITEELEEDLPLFEPDEETSD
jgi:hypothetical protein